MIKWIKSEPVAIAAFINTFLALLIAFGTNLSTDQVGAILAVVNAFLALIVRQNVSPTNPSA